MRIIKYKSKESNEFLNFIDIGSCERDYYNINFFIISEQENKSGKQYFDSYNSWFENFKSEPIGAKMIIINYYLSEYLGWNISENSPQKDYFIEVYGHKTLNIINENLDFLLQFNNKWFVYESSLFKGLDLAFDDIEDNIINTSYNDEGNTSEIEFEDGSKIQFLDEDDSIKSLYVIEEKHFELSKDIKKVIEMFEP
jgi:hypothetical protein